MFLLYHSFLYLKKVVKWVMPLALLIFSLSSCSLKGVEPWERDILSAPDMQFSQTDLSQNMSRQFYSSKEGSHGGAGFAGGGCGCN